MLNQNLSLTNSSTGAKTPSSLGWIPLALHCLGLTLRFDYLSNGKGHKQARSVLTDRSLIASQDEASQSAQKKQLKNSTDDAALTDAEQRYLSEIANKKRLTSSEEYMLALRMQTQSADARIAQEKLIEANLGLVVMFAYRYQRPGVPLMDLVAEGNFGLMTAAKRFDPELGYRFSTYAKWWIRQSIQLAMPKLAGVVRIPVSETAKRNLVLRNANQANQANQANDNADTDAAAQLSEISISLPHQDTSDNAPDDSDAKRLTFLFNDDDALDSLTADQEQEPPSVIMLNQRNRVLQSALAELSERERTIISERFALINEQPCTLDDLSKRFGISIERTRQIENAALKKLQKTLQLAGLSAQTMI
jgi:RNA polymerase nonessential primary-like sigma factor